jgi:tRNA modification GTPase
MSLARHSNTIVAPITAVGGAVAVLRVSGPEAWEVGARVFDAWPSPVVARAATYGRFLTGDDGFVLPFAAGHSYTEEESVELSVHGSPAAVRALVSACLEAGARMAEPGEFTLRAFMNGRIDLTQAEGVRDTVNASTEAQLRQANLLREGALRDQVKAIRREVEGVLAAVEASTDFSEEVGELDRLGCTTKLRIAASNIAVLQASERASRVVREGAVVAIVGLPNAGKSSLLNTLLKSDRAIVTDIPGTTRDTIEESLSMDGLQVRLIDTAGLRETQDVVEALGVERSRHAIDCADVVVYLFDASIGWQADDQALFESLPRGTLAFANKSDISPGTEHGIEISCKTGDGIHLVVDYILRVLSITAHEEALVNRRHAPILERAKQSIVRADKTLCSDLPSDLAAVDLQAAIRSLGEITGETTPPDVLERIFHDFCIGK